MDSPSNNPNRENAQIDISQQINFSRNCQDSSIEIKLIQNMERLWRNEKFCKDLLKFDEEIVSEIVEKLEKRVKF